MRRASGQSIINSSVQLVDVVPDVYFDPFISVTPGKGAAGVLHKVHAFCRRVICRSRGCAAAKPRLRRLCAAFGTEDRCNLFDVLFLDQAGTFVRLRGWFGFSVKRWFGFGER